MHAEVVFLAGNGPVEAHGKKLRAAGDVEDLPRLGDTRAEARGRGVVGPHENRRSLGDP